MIPFLSFASRRAARAARARPSHPRSLGITLEALEPRLLLTLEPTGPEQELLERINHFRVNPAGEFARLVSSTNPVTSPIPGVADALNYYHVNLNQLQNELNALTPVPPLAWNSALSDAADGHNQKMIAANSQSHQLPGEDPFWVRDQNAGYTGWSGGSENIFAFATSVAYAHAAFVVDWAPGTPDGMLNPRGHRNNTMSTQVREVGLSVTPHPKPDPSSNDVGPLVTTEDFGNRTTLTQPYLLGASTGITTGITPTTTARALVMSPSLPGGPPAPSRPPLGPRAATS